MVSSDIVLDSSYGSCSTSSKDWIGLSMTSFPCPAKIPSRCNRCRALNLLLSAGVSIVDEVEMTSSCGAIVVGRGGSGELFLDF